MKCFIQGVRTVIVLQILQNTIFCGNFFTYIKEIVAYTHGHREFRTTQHVGMYLRTRIYDLRLSEPREDTHSPAFLYLWSQALKF